MTLPPATDIGADPGADIGADTPIWDELAPRWAQLQDTFRKWDAGVVVPDGFVVQVKPSEPDQPVPAGEVEPDMPPRPRSTPRRSPNKASTGSSTRRAANTPQTPTEKASVPAAGVKP